VQPAFESVDLQINGLVFRANPGVASFHVSPQRAGDEEVHFTQLRINRTLFFETGISDRQKRKSWHVEEFRKTIRFSAPGCRLILLQYRILLFFC
jgi:hypothetical protein